MFTKNIKKTIYYKKSKGLLVFVVITFVGFIAINTANAAPTQSLANANTKNSPRYCPSEDQLQKNGLWWSSKDGAWRCYSQSFAKNIDTFIGAQWVGVKIGKIICMYKGKNGMDFPIAMEQVRSDVIIEPSGETWSALVQGYKFCKSTNIADCPFYARPKADTEDIYEQIKYQRGTTTNNGNT